MATEPEARAVLAEARTILERHPDSGIFPELLERQESARFARASRETVRSSTASSQSASSMCFGCSAASSLPEQMAQRLYVAPSTVRTQIKSIYRKLGVSSRKQAVEEAYLRKLLL